MRKRLSWLLKVCHSESQVATIARVADLLNGKGHRLSRSDNEFMLDVTVDLIGQASCTLEHSRSGLDAYALVIERQVALDVDSNSELVDALLPREALLAIEGVHDALFEESKRADLVLVERVADIWPGALSSLSDAAR